MYRGESMKRKKTLGKFIRHIRTSRGLSQEEMAFGICSTRHLSSIENDSTYPSIVLIQLLSSKLGFDLSKYYSYSYYINPVFVSDTIEKLDVLFKESKYHEIATLITELEKNEDFSSHETLQLIYWYKAVCALEVNGNINESHVELDKAFKVSATVGINEAFKKEVFTPQEVQILITYSKLMIEEGRLDEAIVLIEELEQILKSMSKIWIEKKHIYRIKLTYNKAHLLFATKRFKEAKETLEKMLDFVINSNDFIYLSNYYFLLGMTYCELKETEKANQFFDYFFDLRLIARKDKYIGSSYNHIKDKYSYINSKIERLI